MPTDRQVEASTHHCMGCDIPLTDGHLVFAVYRGRVLQSFEHQIDLGLIGANVRNAWLHVNCAVPLLKDWNMLPDIHNCIRCKKQLSAKDLIQPVFQVIDPKAVNPADPTDIGIALNERVYMVHCACDNPQLSHSSIIL